MGVFSRKKKTDEFAVNRSDSLSSPVSQTETPRSISEYGPFSLRGKSFYKAIASSSKSFRLRTKKGGAGLLSPTSPANPGDTTPVRHRSLMKLSDDSASSEISHHSPNTVPPMSPAMAAIHARTVANMEREARKDKQEEPAQEVDLTDTEPLSLQDRKENLPDRPERRRTARGISVVKNRKEESTGLSDHWMININDLVIGKTIGHSSFGTVNVGKLNGTKVAVKTIQYGSSPDSLNSLSSFKKEAELNCKLRHPNVVLFMGIAVQPKKICIVTELMSRGNVRDLLVTVLKGKPLRLDWSLRQQWALDTAQGMAYLHSLDPPMIHRDLKTNNLLVDRGMNVKICDFGLSRFKSDKLMSAVGTVHFAAPEVLNHEQYSEKADLFSFGTVMWELYTRDCVFKGLPQIEVYNRVISGNMPDVDKDCDPRYAELMKQCWEINPTNRPSFREVIDRLGVLVDELDTGF